MNYDEKDTIYSFAADAVELFSEIILAPNTTVRTEDIKAMRRCMKKILDLAKTKNIIDDYDSNRLESFLWEKHELYVAAEKLERATKNLESTPWTAIDNTNFVRCWYHKPHDNMTVLCAIYQNGHPYYSKEAEYTVYAQAFDSENIDNEQAFVHEAAAEIFRGMYRVGIFLKTTDNLSAAIEYAETFMKNGWKTPAKYPPG